jgi:integrase
MKMKKMKFTQANVNAYRAPAGVQEHTVHDEGLPGFGLRVQAGGSKVYVVRYRLGAKQGRVSLGNAEKVTLEAAKKAARRLFEQVANKIDPAKARAKAVAATAYNIPAMVEDFCSYLERKNRAKSWVKFNRFALSVHWKPLHKYSLADIDRGDVAKRLVWLSENSGKTSSDQCRSVLQKFFNWAIAEGVPTSNPVVGTNKNGGEKRKRLLTPAELKKIWNGVEDDDYGKIVKLLMLNGQRLSEMGDLQRKETSLSNKLISLPGERTKNKLPHDIPLSAPAIGILKSINNTGGEDFLFGSGKSETKGFRGWSKSKERLDEKIKLTEHWTHHDLRRAASTYMRQECKVLPHIVEAVLNHVSGDDKGGVAGVYNQAKYNPEKRDALDKYAKWITSIAA